MIVLSVFKHYFALRTGKMRTSTVTSHTVYMDVRGFIYNCPWNCRINVRCKLTRVIQYTPHTTFARPHEHRSIIVISMLLYMVAQNTLEVRRDL